MLNARTWGRSRKAGRSIRLGLAGVLVLTAVVAAPSSAGAATAYTVDLGKGVDFVA